ncbi:hypothetical protein Golomagni_04622 [Golovinomyces magnicellulatus]|nr:hypothetical protein Golomagni_04622 [Golovinomyces magnicellulatus]
MHNAKAFDLIQENPAELNAAINNFTIFAVDSARKNTNIETTHHAMKDPHRENLGETGVKTIQNIKIMQEPEDNLKDKEMKQLHIRDAH